jgi:hypothetical protein
MEMRKGMKANEHAIAVSVLSQVFAATGLMSCSRETSQDTIVVAAEPGMSELTGWVPGQPGKRPKDSQGPNLTWR